MPDSLVTITLPPNPVKSLSGYAQTSWNVYCSAWKKALPGSRCTEGSG